LASEHGPIKEYKMNLVYIFLRKIESICHSNTFSAEYPSINRWVKTSFQAHWEFPAGYGWLKFGGQKYQLHVDPKCKLIIYHEIKHSTDLINDIWWEIEIL